MIAVVVLFLHLLCPSYFLFSCTARRALVYFRDSCFIRIPLVVVAEVVVVVAVVAVVIVVVVVVVVVVEISACSQQTNSQKLSKMFTKAVVHEASHLTLHYTLSEILVHL